MSSKIEDFFFTEYLKYFRLAEDRRRWNIDKSIPWDEINPNASDIIADVCETFSGVELYLPDYTSKILHLVRRSRGRAWFQANWGYEESKHSLVLEQWLLRSGKRTPEQIKEFEENVFEGEWEMPFQTPRQMIIYTMIQELATWVNYCNLRTLAIQDGDAALEKLLRLVSADEKAHYTFFRKGVKAYLEYEPQETLQDLAHVFDNFYMPAKYQLKDYDRRAQQIKDSGIYGPRDYVSRVKRPIMDDLGIKSLKRTGDVSPAPPDWKALAEGTGAHAILPHEAPNGTATDQEASPGGSGAEVL